MINDLSMHSIMHTALYEKHQL